MIIASPQCIIKQEVKLCTYTNFFSLFRSILFQKNYVVYNPFFIFVCNYLLLCDVTIMSQQPHAPPANILISIRTKVSSIQPHQEYFKMAFKIRGISAAILLIQIICK